MQHRKLLSNLAVVLLLGSTPCYSFDQDKYNIPEHTDWMSNLRDDVPVRLVSIPGAHDAASGSSNVAGTSCQNMNIKDLFDAGVRFFDLRTGFTNGVELRMYHGFVDLARTFEGVMDDLYKKMEDYPEEFLIVEITIENDTKRKGDAADHLRSYFRHSYDEEGVKCVHEYWDTEDEYDKAKSKWMYLTPNVTVKEARGHILLMFNNIYDELERMAGPYIPTREDGPGALCKMEGYYEGKRKFTTTFHSQNNYHDELFDLHVDEKFYKYAKPECELFTEYINQNPDSVTWCMNFLSAYIDLIPNQYDVAGPVNGLFAQFVNQHPELYLGIVLMDYAAVPIYKNMTSTAVNGDVALEAVINNNRRFWDERKLVEKGRNRREPYEMHSN